MSDNPYLLLTPGPLTTTATVRQAMLRDLSTWDVDYHAIVQDVRRRLIALVAEPADDAVGVLLQGSGTFAVEATLGSIVPDDGRLAIVNNGAYGARMAHIAQRLRLPHVELRLPETEPATPERLARLLAAEGPCTHVAYVHCETTTGLLNPVAELGRVAAAQGVSVVVDAMSSFGGIPLSLRGLAADYLISSSNKCVQGTPGCGFVVARRAALAGCAGRARSLSLDLYDQWREMEELGGKWRYTSPTHVVCALAQALVELEQEGGVAARHARYRENQRRLVAGLEQLGLATLLPAALHSPIITAFYSPPDAAFTFAAFYERLKARGFVIYPGKVTVAETFRIGNIGDVHPADIDRLVAAIADVLADMGVTRLRPELQGAAVASVSP